MRDVATIDQPKWPMVNGPTARAHELYHAFEATDKAITYDDPAQRFHVIGFLATCRMEAEVHTDGFSWKSDPITTVRPLLSRCEAIPKQCPTL